MWPAPVEAAGSPSRPRPPRRCGGGSRRARAPRSPSAAPAPRWLTWWSSRPRAASASDAAVSRPPGWYNRRGTVSVPGGLPVRETDAVAGQETGASEEEDVARLRRLVEESDVEGARAFVKVLQAKWPESNQVAHWAQVLAPPRTL